MKFTAVLFVFASAGMTFASASANPEGLFLRSEEFSYMAKIGARAPTLNPNEPKPSKGMPYGKLLG
jgi:hypothetical protein